MSKSSLRRIRNRMIRKGVIQEIKIRTGRSAETSEEVRRLIKDKIAAKEVGKLPL